MWIWEHQRHGPGGDEKQEREEWHVTQDGAKLTGYYDRVVRQVSTDGHAYRCSMALEFQIATRYQIRGEVRGSQVIIYENSFEVLSPNACDNGKRRLDAYEGQAPTDELRLVWGVGGQVLRRPRPDVADAAVSDPTATRSDLRTLSLALVGLQLFVDRGLEGVERLRADEAGAVDEEGRRAGRADRGALLGLARRPCP